VGFVGEQSQDNPRDGYVSPATLLGVIEGKNNNEEERETLPSTVAGAVRGKSWQRGTGGSNKTSKSQLRGQEGKRVAVLIQKGQRSDKSGRCRRKLGRDSDLLGTKGEMHATICKEFWKRSDPKEQRTHS